MDCNGYEIKVPGKLFIAGEYAVLEPGYDSIVVAVDRYVTAIIKEEECGVVHLKDIGLEDVSFHIKEETVEFDTDNDKISFVRASFLVVQEYLRSNGVDMKPFSLEITSSLNDKGTGKKYGLGSSAAIVVATVSAILSIHQLRSSRGKLHQDRELIFKLSAIAHVKTQGNGSGADIAAAVYGGWIDYRSFDYRWLLRKLESLRKVSDLLDIPWIHLKTQKLSPPSKLSLAVGWTKEDCQTQGMVSKVEAFKKVEKSLYLKFLKDSKSAVESILSGFSMDRVDVTMDGLKKNKLALAELGRLSNVPIIPVEMEKLCAIADKYGCGKSSGAGGGDCGIAFIPTEYKKLLEIEWNHGGIMYLDLNIDTNGVQVTKL